MIINGTDFAAAEDGPRHVTLQESEEQIRRSASTAMVCTAGPTSFILT
jgi:hypothetical protein